MGSAYIGRRCISIMLIDIQKDLTTLRTRIDDARQYL